MVRLYHLPLLVIQQVVGSMDLRDIFVISLTSKRSKQILKSCFPKNYIRIKLCFENTLKFKSNDLTFLNFFQSRNQILEFEEYTIGSEALRFGFYPDQVYCCTTENGGDMIDYMADIFNGPIFTLLFTPEETSAAEIIRYAKQKQLTIDTINYVPHENAVQMDYTEVINECRNVSKLFLKGALEYSPPTPDFFKLDALRIIYYRHWVGVENFLQCKHIWIIGQTPYLSNGMVTPREFNAAFRRIIETKCRVEYLMFQLHKRIDLVGDSEIILNGLSEKKWVMGPNGERILNIDRKDGKKSTITVTWISVELRPQGDTTDFRESMWEDF